MSATRPEPTVVTTVTTQLYHSRSVLGTVRMSLESQDPPMLRHSAKLAEAQEIINDVLAELNQQPNQTKGQS